MHRHYSKNSNPMTTATGPAEAASYFAAYQSYPPSVTDYPTPASDYLLSSDLLPMENEFVSSWEIPPSTWIGSRPEAEMFYYSGIPALEASPLITTTFPCKFTPPETSMTSHDTMLYYASPSLPQDRPPAAPSPGVGRAPLHTDHPNRCRWIKCPLSFTTLDELILHIREDHVGSGKAAYFCFWAGCPRHKKPFTKRHKMHNHMRTHTGERPFACTVPGCVKRFSRPDSLMTHIKTHSNIRPYHCKTPGCSKAYFHSRSLRKHTRSHEQKAAAATAAVSSYPQPDPRSFPTSELPPL